MNKEQILKDLSLTENTLNRLKQDFDKSESKYVSRKQTQQEIKSIAKKWFEEIEPVIQQFGVGDSVREKYHEEFTKLLEYSLKKVVWKKTYQRLLKEFLQGSKTTFLS